jgi:hypothetical protein
MSLLVLTILLAVTVDGVSAGCKTTSKARPMNNNKVRHSQLYFKNLLLFRMQHIYINT